MLLARVVIWCEARWAPNSYQDMDVAEGFVPRILATADGPMQTEKRDLGIFRPRLANPFRLYIITVTVYIYR
jgi:hypothetical protein